MLDVVHVLFRPGRGGDVGHAGLVVAVVLHLHRVTHVGVPPDGVAGVHARDADHALREAQVGVGRGTQELTVVPEGPREPRGLPRRVKGPSRGVHDVRLVRRRAEKGAQQEVRHCPLDVGVEHETALPRPRRREGGPPLEAPEDARVGRPGEHGLIGLLALREVVRVEILRATGEDGVVKGPVHRVSPAAQAARVDVRAQPPEGHPGRPNADPVGVRQWLRGRRPFVVVPPRIQLGGQPELIGV